MRILGIDPGYATTGFGVLHSSQGQLHLPDLRPAKRRQLKRKVGRRTLENGFSEQQG